MKRDAGTAVNWFRLAAERGNASAMLNLGLCYFNGTGVSRDHKAAGKWLNAVVDPSADFSEPAPPADWFKKGAEPSGNDEAALSGALPVAAADRIRATAHFLLGEIAAEDGDNTQAQNHYV